MVAILKKIIDGAVLWLMSWRLIARPCDYLAYRRKRVVRRKVEEGLRKKGILGDTVLSGPFAGMLYPPHDRYFISCRFEKLVGCFELEVAGWIEELAAGKDYSSIINIGAAEGSYAVGLARLFPKARIQAYESDAGKIGTLMEIARLNGVAGRISTGGWCDPATLASYDPGLRPLVVCDVDGYEDELMDPAKVPWLTRADILLELHEFLAHDLMEDERSAFERRHPYFRRDLGARIRNRFSNSHHIRNAVQGGIPYGNFPILGNLTMHEILAMTDSDRACLQNWFLMESKEKPHTGSEPACFDQIFRE